MRYRHTIFNPLNRRGDTIVEVLIAVAVATAVLAGAYAVTTQDLKTTQDVKDRNQALLLVRQQIELLRDYVATNQTAFPVASSSCLTPSAAGTTLCTVKSGTVTTGVASPTCSKSFCYTVKIILPNAAKTDQYEVGVTWPNQHNSNSTVAMDYKVAP